MECHSKLIVTQYGVYLKIKSHLKLNVTQNEMSLKQNVIKDEISLKMECYLIWIREYHSKWNVTQN